MTKNKKLTEKEVKHIAKLANLPLSEREIPKFKEQLSKILDYVATISSINTDSIAPTSQITGLTNRERKDQSQPSFSQDDALKNAKSTHNGFIKIKAIFSE